MFRVMTARRSPQEIVDAAYQDLHHPIIAFDTSFRLIAFAFPRPFSYRAWDVIAEEGVLPADYIQNSNSLDYQEMMYSQGKSRVYDWGTAKNYPQVCGPIMSGGELLGYAGIGIEQYPDTQKLARINDCLCDTLAVSIRDSIPAELYPGRLAEKVLLSDRTAEEDLARLRAQCGGDYLLARLTAEGNLVSTLEYAKSQLCRPEFHSFGAIGGGKTLWILFTDVPDEYQYQQIFLRLHHAARILKLTGALSDYFSDLSELAAHRQQAELAESLSRKGTDDCFLSFRGEYVTILVQNVTLRLGTTIPVPWQIRRLAELDDRKKTDYILTLETYFRCSCGLAETAEALGVHKNTIHYRLKRISEITKTDLKNAEDCELLRDGLMIHRKIRQMSAEGGAI